VNKITRVVEHHDDHDNAAQEIDRIDALAGKLRGLWIDWTRALRSWVIPVQIFS
jgi:hypothetical protein